MQKTDLRIALCQLNYKLCDFQGNVALIRAALAGLESADLVVFSEMCLSGYHPQDMVEEPYFLPRQDEALAAVLEASRGMPATLVLGAVTRNQGVGKPLQNGLLVVRGGEVLLTYHKQLLPTYDIFDERRHFEPGHDAPALLELCGRKVGFLICEDGWNDEELHYPINPFRRVVEAGAELVVSINASPSDVGKQRQRHGIFGAACRRYGVPLVFVNQVGGNDQLVFDGASFLVAADGAVVHALPSFEERVETVVFDGGWRVSGEPRTGRFEAYLDDADFYYRQVVLGLQDYVRKVGFRGVVVGSSGGIDSALTLALAADALGPDQVKAITLPSPYSSAGSVDDSVELCRNLGVELFRHPISDLFATYKLGFAEAFGREPTGLAAENLQARIRGTVLMAYSNQFGHLVISTGNKSEMSVGYATLYGDMNGGLNLIGDLYKTEVYAVCRHYNALHGTDRIPLAILEKPPSAELAPGQKDTDSLPPYEVLDEILKLHIEGKRLRPAEYAAASAFVAGLEARGDAALVRRIHTLVARAEFKRRQAAPIIRVRGRAFGTGRQMPIAASYG